MTMKFSLVLLLSAGLNAFFPFECAVTAHEIRFERIQLSNEFHSEGGTFGDFDVDGNGDIAVGPWIYWGPDYLSKSAFYEGKPFDPAGYSKNFFMFTDDIDGDKLQDIVVLGFPGEASWWYKNPGRSKMRTTNWDRYTILEVTDNESPTFVDIDGDGAKDVVCSSKGHYGFATRSGQDPTQLWRFVEISPNNKYHKFTHGLGVGDVNNDKRMDLIEKDGWWENPGSVAANANEHWKHHPYKFSNSGGAQMFAYDVDGDGLNEVVAGLVAHGYGLCYFQSKNRECSDFEKIDIMTNSAATSPAGLAIGQLHAVDVADIHRDGKLDIITGKRWWAHANKDESNTMPATLLWLELTRLSGRVAFVPHVIDNSSGVGTQVCAGDVNGDGLIDVVSGNKRGAYLFLQIPSGRTEQFAPEMASKDPFGQNLASMSVPIKDELGGFRPALSADRPLNFDFESNDSNDWEIRGSIPKSSSSQSVTSQDVQPHGRSWFGTQNGTNDKAIGEAISRPFVLTHPWVSFLIGGAKGPATFVEIISEQSGKSLVTVTGMDRDSLRREFADLTAWKDTAVRIRVVDHEQNAGGHLLFDDFRLHAAKP